MYTIPCFYEVHMFSYKIATEETFDRIWDKNIARHPGDARWVNWRKEYKEYNRSGMALTFLVLKGEEPVGEGTLVFDPQCKCTAGNTLLADNKTTVYLNTLRMEKRHEGGGHISRLVKMMEKYAREKGYSYITIGVDDSNERNKAIYTHWGYTETIYTEVEDGELVLYWRKKL